MILYIRIWALPWVRRTAYGLLTLVIIYNLLAVVMVATACIPLSAFWDLSIKGAYCHVKNIWWANTYLHVIVDFLIYLLPMPVIIRVHFPRRQKVLLFVLFAFGFLLVYPAFCSITPALTTSNQRLRVVYHPAIHTEDYCRYDGLHFRQRSHRVLVVCRDKRDRRHCLLHDYETSSVQVVSQSHDA